MVEKVGEIIESSFDKKIANHVVSTFTDIERNFALNRWKECGLAGGHFVEAVRRALDLELFGTYEGFGSEDQLPPFGKDVMVDYITADGPQSYTRIIPYALKAIYNIRNNRGVGHLSEVEPSEMDATQILYSAKWTLAELVRLNSDLEPSGTRKLVEKIMEREISLVWRDEGIRRVLDPSMEAEDQVLVLLLDESPLDAKVLFESIGQASSYNFRERVLSPLHEKRLIHYDEDSGECRISPTGTEKAERIVIEQK